MDNNIFNVESFSYEKFINKFGSFRIPPFQRSYNWKETNINELWESIIEQNTGYFIGTFVCLEPHENDKKLIIIDGQQRIITISLILSAIYYKYEDLGENLVDEE